ncbi:MAG TPA: DUF2236 domain-containing protein, partial [Mycobacterium sp.]|nr:DUF2236 domain-containing protein [Mycobacterium sp.]
PSPLPGIALLLLRAPLIAGLEVARRVVPGIDRTWQRVALHRWEDWLRWESGGDSAEFEAAKALRR